MRDAVEEGDESTAGKTQHVSGIKTASWQWAMNRIHDEGRQVNGMLELNLKRKMKEWQNEVVGFTSSTWSVSVSYVKVVLKRTQASSILTNHIVSTFVNKEFDNDLIYVDLGS